MESMLLMLLMLQRQRLLLLLDCSGIAAPNCMDAEKMDAFLDTCGKMAEMPLLVEVVERLCPVLIVSNGMQTKAMSVRSM